VSPTQSRVSPSIQRILREKASIGAIDSHWVHRPLEPSERGKRDTRVCIAQTKDTAQVYTLAPLGALLLLGLPTIVLLSLRSLTGASNRTVRLETESAFAYWSSIKPKP